jgi:hypothetical protein
MKEPPNGLSRIIVFLYHELLNAAAADSSMSITATTISHLCNARRSRTAGVLKLPPVFSTDVAGAELI